MATHKWKSTLSRLKAGRNLAVVAVTALTLGAGELSAQASDPTSLTVAMMWESNPLNIKSRRSRFFNESEVLDTLVKLDYELQPVPGLATSWERTSPTEWLFHLRDGVRFHDGSDLTAAVVANSFQHVLKLLPYAPGMLDIAEISPVDRLTLKIRTNQPFAALPNQLTDAITGIYGEASFDVEGNYVKPVGTGPFRFVSYTKQDRTIVERFEDYWGDAPVLERVIYRYIPDHSARALALEAGEIDMAVNVLPADVQRLSDNPEFTVYREPAAGLYYMVLNTAKGSEFSDVKLRRAVNLLVDRDALVTYGLDGVGIPARELLSPEFDLVPGPAPEYARDVSQAEELLRAAGYSKVDGFWSKDGVPLTLKMVSYTSRAEMTTITETVANMLKQHGISSSVEMYTWPGMQDVVKSGDYDAYTVFWTPEMTGHPDTYLRAHYTSNSTMMNSGYGNVELDDLLTRARGMDAGAERDAAYQRILQIIHEDAPILPLVHRVYVAATRNDVQGYRVHPSGFFFDFKNVSKE